MRFSEHFDIAHTTHDEWYDPHLTIDTPLFIDPLLIYRDDSNEWSGAHDRIISHFVACYQLIAHSQGRESNSGQAALRLLTFPEPSEFSLGLTKRGTNGSGSGGKYAKQIADGIAVALAAGLADPEHIEEIGILNKGIGADRISDAVCNILKSEFAAYTQRVCEEYDVEREPLRLKNAICSTELGRWSDATLDLPKNPYTGKPILLVPEKFLNDLPSINANDWLSAPLNADLRAQLNLTVGRRAKKERIVEVARRNPSRVREWAQQQTTRPDLSGYDFSGDPFGVVHWDSIAKRFVDQHPLEGIETPATLERLVGLVETVIGQFRLFIEEQRGWEALWNDNGSPKRESAAQLIFLGIAQNYLRVFGVEIDREVDLGRGPVDFKVIGGGPSVRALIEVKKVHNGKFWNGLEQQLPSYMTSDAANVGWFLAVRYWSGGVSSSRVGELPGRVSDLAAATGKNFRFAVVDARRPISASNIDGRTPERGAEGDKADEGVDDEADEWEQGTSSAG